MQNMPKITTQRVGCVDRSTCLSGGFKGSLRSQRSRKLVVCRSCAECYNGDQRYDSCIRRNV